MQYVTLILYPKWLAPMTQAPGATQNQQTWLEHHACIILDSKIIDVLPVADVPGRYQAQFEYNLPDHLLLPGLFNSHTHAAMSLMRGFADDYPLITWLEDYIWPAENTCVSSSFVQTGTELAICEMLESGVTCFNDMYFFPETVAKILDETGLRGCISGPILEFPSAWGQSAADYIAKNTEVVAHYKSHPRVSAGYGPHAPYTVSNRTFETIIDKASEYKTWIHIHLHETVFEIEQSLKEFKMRPIQRLHELGLFNTPVQAVHMTQLNDNDIALIKNSQCHVIHCPESNLKLASGFAPIAQIQNANINIGIGTDGAASNNDLDMVSELRTAAILAKAVANDAQALPAYSALYAATRGGALAFGQRSLGSITPGYEADVIAVNMNHWNTQPVYDPIAQFVYATNNRQISHVWVAGKLVCEHGQVKVFDTENLRHNVQQWRSKIFELKRGS